MKLRNGNGKLILGSLAGIALLVGCLYPGDSAGTREDGGNAALSTSSGSFPGVEKVYVCHIPPGNPANAHTIHVGAPAVRAHLAHGDSLGKCGGVVDTNHIGRDSTYY
jgi:hypothetical protein